MRTQDLLGRICDDLADIRGDKVNQLVEEALAVSISPVDIIEQGLRPGITMVGDRYSAGEAFLPELMLAAKVMQDAIEILKPEMAKRRTQTQSLGRVVMGTIAGDLHDLGKNLVITLLDVAGFEVFDLGVDVPSQKFVESVVQLEPHVVGMSALMSTTIREQQVVINDLIEAGLRDQVKVAVGGAAVTPDWAERIGADGYGDNAIDAVRMIKNLLGV